MTVALVYGSVFHECLHNAFSGKVWNAKASLSKYFLRMPELVKQDNWDGEVTVQDKDGRPEDMASWIEEAVNLVLHARTTKPQAVELKLRRQFPTFTLVGTVDALWDGALVDFKLAGRSYEADDLQTACYAVLNGGPSEFDFWIVRKEATPRLEIEHVPLAGSQKYLDWVVSKVLTPTAKAIEAGHFPANPSYQFCSKLYCQYWAVCIGSVR